MSNSKEKLILARLSKYQLSVAGETIGWKKASTHVVLCGKYGQIFGTEKHCRKYYTVWSKIFPKIFSEAIESDVTEIPSYENTFDLVNILIAEHDRLMSSK